MSRIPKNQAVETLEFKEQNRKVQIYLNTQSGTFEAHINNDWIRAETLKKIRDLITTKVRELENVQWFPYIAIQFPKPELQYERLANEGPREDSDTAFMSIDFERLYLGKRGKRVFYLSWEDHKHETGQNLTACSLPYSEWISDLPLGETCRTKRAVTMPYNEALWKRLNTISNTLRELNRSLKNLIGEGPQAIMGSRMLMLPENAKAEETNES